MSKYEEQDAHLCGLLGWTKKGTLWYTPDGRRFSVKPARYSSSLGLAMILALQNGLDLSLSDRNLCSVTYHHDVTNRGNIDSQSVSEKWEDHTTHDVCLAFTIVKAMITKKENYL
jgi:hypothetical protein